jgi:glutathione S-transferase
MWESCAIMRYLCNKHHPDKFYIAYVKGQKK